MKFSIKKIINISVLLIISLVLSSCSFDFLYTEKTGETIETETSAVSIEEKELILVKEVYIDFSAPYATYSIINDGFATLYYHNPSLDSAYIKRKVVAVNAGHGTKNGSQVKTFAHPDFTPKVAGGTTKEGSILASAISDGAVLNNGMKEADANLLVAEKLKDKLLLSDYDVLMIRVDDDCRLDNIARTVIANENADIHIAIHFDSTETDKGAFFITPFNDENYLNMEPLKSNKDNIKKLGKSLIEGFKEVGVKVWKDSGTLQGDLTQMSYSTNASVDIEVGDKATEISEEKIDSIANSLLCGIDKYFEN